MFLQLLKEILMAVETANKTRRQEGRTTRVDTYKIAFIGKKDSQENREHSKTKTEIT